MGPIARKAFGGCVKTWVSLTCWLALGGGGHVALVRCLVCCPEAVPLRCRWGLGWAACCTEAAPGPALVLGRRGRKCRPCVDVLTDGGPEAATKQETENAVEVELNSRRRREDHFAWRSLVDRRETLPGEHHLTLRWLSEKPVSKT